MITKRQKQGRIGSRLRNGWFYGFMVMFVATALFLSNTGHEFVVYGSNKGLQAQERRIEAILTGYSSEEGQTDSSPAITAYNTKVRKGIIANNCLGKSTKVLIDGEVYEVEDRKNSRYGCEWVDVWFPTTAEALKFGIRRQIVIIYE